MGKQTGESAVASREQDLCCTLRPPAAEHSPDNNLHRDINSPRDNSTPPPTPSTPSTPPTPTHPQLFPHTHPPRYRKLPPRYTDTCASRHIPAAVSSPPIASVCPQVRAPSSPRQSLAMDAYPPELVAHETPLLLVSGLGPPELHSGADVRPDYSYPQLTENGARVVSSVPPVATPAGELLLLHFMQADSSGLWAGRTTDKLKSQTPAWRIRAVGRVDTPSPTPSASLSMILTPPPPELYPAPSESQPSPK